jgi:hypothetical protein
MTKSKVERGVGESAYTRSLRGNAQGLRSKSRGIKGSIAGSPENCPAHSWSSCCRNVETPCDCKQSPRAPGQCDWAAFEYCCMNRIPCACEFSPNDSLEVTDEELRREISSTNRVE